MSQENKHMQGPSPITDTPTLLDTIRGKFAHIDSCPFSGPRIYFENAGGALTLKSVADTSARFAAIPDNQGRDNQTSKELSRIIEQSKAKMRTFFNAPDGDLFVGETGTELLFRVISAAMLGSAEGGIVIGSTLEHPSTRSACDRWTRQCGKPYVLVEHSNDTGTVTAQDYEAHLSPDVRLATILHTSPVTGMAVDVAAIAASIRAVAPECFIIVDGIQHASHGLVDIASYDVDAYVISPYKAFSRHGYGIAWISDRLAALPHDALKGGPALNWELGTRDTGAYATFSDVIDYFEWLGARVSDAAQPRERIEAAGRAIHAHESALTEAMLNGIDNHAGLNAIPGIRVVGGGDNPRREGLVSFSIEGHDCTEIVRQLNEANIRTHVRKNDHYSGNVLGPLGMPTCVRVSLCHYNTPGEIKELLGALHTVVSATTV